MPRAYSADIRGRVIARVESGASRREAAEHFEISASTAIKWVKCFRDTGSCAAKPRSASTRWFSDQPDLTLDEVVSAMHKRGIAGSRSAVWRFFQAS
jgi:transposase